jgi:predicted chitinase
MSLPLHDLGSIKVSERDHSYLRAKAMSLKMDVAALVRQMIHEQVSRELEVFTLAQQIHESKGLGAIQEDN